MATIYQYKFHDDVRFDDVEDTLLLATAAAESLHSPARMSMDLRYWSEPDNGAVIIDGGTRAGQDLAAIFTGMLRHVLPKRGVTVRRITDYRRDAEAAGSPNRRGGRP
jgi:hypothetical protein